MEVRFCRGVSVEVRVLGWWCAGRKGFCMHTGVQLGVPQQLLLPAAVCLLCADICWCLQLGAAVMVEDTSLCFNAMQGLPGVRAFRMCREQHKYDFTLCFGSSLTKGIIKE